jgi:hypothetical protein
MHALCLVLRYPVESCLLLHPPSVNRFNVEPPVTADLEGRQLTFAQEAIQSGAMDMQVYCELVDRYNFRFGRHH